MIARSFESGTAAMEARRPGDEYSTSESVDAELGYDESKSESFVVTSNIAIFILGIFGKMVPLKLHGLAVGGAGLRGRENVDEAGFKCQSKRSKVIIIPIIHQYHSDLPLSQDSLKQ